MFFVYCFNRIFFLQLIEFFTIIFVIVVVVPHLISWKIGLFSTHDDIQGRWILQNRMRLGRAHRAGAAPDICKLGCRIQAWRTKIGLSFEIESFFVYSQVWNKRACFNCFALEYTQL